MKKAQNKTQYRIVQFLNNEYVCQSRFVPAYAAPALEAEDDWHAIPAIPSCTSLKEAEQKLNKYRYKLTPDYVVKSWDKGESISTTPSFKL